MIDYENSIVLIGPQGVGKTLVAQKLSQQTGLPIISTDVFRYLPSLEEIRDYINDNSKDVRDLAKKSHFNGSAYDMIRLRTTFPNIPNYYQLGFDESVNSSFAIPYECGIYQTQFENAMFDAICKNVNIPVILDTGCGAVLKRDAHYINYLQQHEQCAETLKQHSPKIDYFSDSVAKQIFKPFSNIVYLSYPENDAQLSKKAAMDSDRNFSCEVRSGHHKQYKKMATQTIDTSGLYENGEVCDDKLNEITSRILSQKVSSKER